MENPNSDEDDIHDEIRKMKQKVEEAIKKKEAGKRREQIKAIRNELLKQLAELEADETDIANSSINFQVPEVASQIGTPCQSVSIPKLEGTPQTGQIPVQRTISEQHVALKREEEHNGHIGTQAESFQVPSGSEPQPGESAMLHSSQLRPSTATAVHPTDEPWTKVICLETPGKTLARFWI